MKYLSILALSASMAFVSCAEETATTPATTPVAPASTELPAKAVEEVDPAVAPIMTFQETEFDFGNIQKDEVVSHVFSFTNTGKSDLIISNAKASCGCTVPEYPKTPIAAGETSEIRVEFNSKGKKGPQNKTVTITANTANPTNIIKIKGLIVE